MHSYDHDLAASRVAAARRSGFCLSLSLLLVAACGGSDGGGGPGGGKDAGDDAALDSGETDSGEPMRDSGPMPMEEGGTRTDSGGGNRDAGSDGVCGNGEFEDGELCDDGNTEDGDGCSADCTEVDPDFLCLEAGEACEQVVVCGNGVIEGDESCDDGNTQNDDGCSAECDAVEDGFLCIKPGQACVASPVCGNGMRERGETCDDGQATPEDGDGCDASCQLEDPDAWFCPPGMLCIAVECGDGNRTPGESCDDGGRVPGDGCDAQCEVETGFRCGSTGCRAICGDGMRVGTEQCDDGNLMSGDGCSASCAQEPFYDCPAGAGACTSTIVCGDGCVDPGEICDPGDLRDDCGQADATCTSVAEDPAQACKAFEVVTDPGVCGDGTVNFGEACDPDCSGAPPCNIGGCVDCQIETGWACPGPGYCFQIPTCGDGIIQVGEECDPGPVSHPGCDDTACTINTDYYCSGEPSTCVASVCGDGYVAPDEECDDGPGTPTGGDGCSASCTVETGYVCPPGLDCQPICGNGTLEGGEQCDENSAGCTNCFIEPGYDCDGNGRNCAPTRCGAANSGAPVVERGEGCDDGNDVAGDGCSPTCQVEPTFTHTTSGTPVRSSPSCGDGFKTQSEGCDDGNTTDGDGCSSTCEEEDGWVCDENAIDYPDSIDFQVTYRDFKPKSLSGGHPHFLPGSGFDSATDRGITGQLCSTGNYDPVSPGSNDCGLLDVDGKPRNVKGNSATIAGYLDRFGLWYRDTNPNNLTGANGVIDMYSVRDTITLDRNGTTSAYELDDSAFFDMDNRGFGNNPGLDHNYDFTTELRYFFQYRGGEELIFEGDDDVWVFVNGRLAVDVGGIHCPHAGRVVLGDENGSCNVQADSVNGCNAPNVPACTTYSASEQADNTDGRFGLTKGEVYEIALFHAERNPYGSNFRLTLDGFLAPRSTCTTDCGDGIRAGNEICDTASGQTSGYNVCLDDCSVAFCGDGTRQSAYEACDSANKVTYRQNQGGCGFDCQRAPYCGDGEVQAFAGEVCDDGVNDGSYGSCSADCRSFAGYCGDGVVDPVEDCDDGSKVAYQADGSGCGYDCRWAPSCGDGVRNGPETCEPPGTAQCDDDCQIQPYCGDGIRSPGESCDYGSFNAPPMDVAYSGCDTGCELGPHCGDGTLQDGAGEECDDGDANEPAASADYGTCTTGCLLGPRCGDGVVQAGAGEDCDNGFNEDSYAYDADACGPSCTAVPRCGDGIVEASVELCDEGDANNDTAYDGCRTDCQWGPYCGDGLQNGSEECDDPNGNVAYSPDGMGCSFDCKLNVPYCGDGVRNGPERCDDGEAENDGAYGGCNEDCTRAAYCGDGIVQEDDGEGCDDGPTGSLNCGQDCQFRVLLK